MHPFLVPLTAAFEKNANPAEAAAMAAYMRGQFAYHGIKSPLRKQLTRDFLAAHGNPDLDDLPAITHELWALPQREYQYVAMTLTDRAKKNAPATFIGLYEHMIVTKLWWDTIDLIASHEIGTHFKRFPDVRAEYLAKWRASDNFWLRRTCLLFQLGYKQYTDVDLLFSLIRENLGSKEFFINKAIGWTLREYSKTDAPVVRAFVKKTALEPLSEREALKWLKAKNLL